MTLQNVLHICRRVNIKLNKDKCHFRCTSFLCFGEVISRNIVTPDPWKCKVLLEMPLINKKGLSILWNNYLIRFCTSTADIWESLRKLTSVKTEWTWNVTYQKMFNKANSIIKQDVCMKFCEETKLLYLETYVSWMGLGAALHEVVHTACEIQH